MAQFIFANFPLGIPCGQDVRTHYIRCIVNVNSLIAYSQRSASDRSGVMGDSSFSRSFPIIIAVRFINDSF